MIQPISPTPKINNMTADIFPGLAEPKSQLMKDIQDMIDKNGGLLPLARRIESEQTHIYRPRYVMPPGFNAYKKFEVDFIIENYKNMTSQKIAEKLMRSASALRHKIHRMQLEGLIEFKLETVAILERKTAL